MKTVIAKPCMIDFAFRRIGGKHKGRILWYLNEQTVMRFGELRRRLGTITPKMLTQTLRELETDGLIERRVYPEVPPKVEYRLSDTGAELIPFLNHLRIWATKQHAKTLAVQ